MYLVKRLLRSQDRLSFVVSSELNLTLNPLEVRLYLHNTIQLDYWSLALIGSAISAAAEAEEAFCLGLTENCPKCGRSGLNESDQASVAESQKKNKPGAKLTVYDIRKHHITACTDKALHRAYRNLKTTQEAAEKMKTEKMNSQEEVQQLAAWEFLGADTTQLWLLENNNLRVCWLRL